MSKSQKMQKNRLAKTFDLLYNKNTIKNLNKKEPHLAMRLFI